MKQSKCPLCGERLKKGSTTCRCGYRETLAEQELLRRLAVAGDHRGPVPVRSPVWGRKRGASTWITAHRIFRRAAPGRASVFSGIGVVILVAGVILSATPAIAAGVIIAVIGGVMGASGGKKLQGAAQGRLAQDALRAVFQEAEYLPRQHISQETLQASGLPLPQAERMSGSGLVRARYHGRPLEISNLELLDLQPYQDPATQNWENNEVSVFRGRWMAAQLGHTLPCDLQAAPKGKLARLLGRDGFSSEDPEFDKRFSVQCGDPAAAQTLLSPQVMDQLLHLGKVYLSVKADGRVFAAIQTDEPLFDAGKGRADQMKERFVGQLRDFTDLLDAMRG